jgi:hypothetical protein
MDADAVARFSVGSHSSAMRQTRQRGQRFRQNVMGGLALESGDKSDAARLKIEPRIDQALTGASTLAGDPESGPGAAGRQGRVSTISRSHIQL